jgi:hypothetical protein
MCCGKSRAQFPRTMANPPPPRLAPQVAGPQPPMARYPSTTFEYTGQTGLTVTGPVTGRQYRFDRAGSRVGVDPRDRPSIAAIPVLRQVR